MNYKPQNAKELISRHLHHAMERLESAKALLKIDNYEDAILDAATACLIAKDVVPKSHAGAMKLFSLHYIKSGEVENRYQKQFARIEKARIEADYTHLKKFSKEEAKEIYKEASEFVEMSKKLLA